MTTSLLNASDCRSLFTDYLKEQITVSEPSKLYIPIEYIMSAGGKRVRPTLVLLANQLFEVNLQEALKAALAIETFHNFTLVHDDMMDQDAMRRGRPTVHIKFGDNAAILSGDLMLIQAYQYLQEVPSHHQAAVLSVFTQTAKEVCEGQQWDMDFEERTDVSISEYLNMIRLKTAVLLAASLKIGALLGNASEQEAQLLYDFGIEMGLAFQIMDDWLDTFGDQNKTGKTVGSDIARNKKTFLYLRSLELADGPTKARLEALFSQEMPVNHPKTQEVIAIFNHLNISELTRNLAEKHYQKGVDLLNQLTVPTEKKSPLLDISQLLMQRER